MTWTAMRGRRATPARRVLVFASIVIGVMATAWTPASAAPGNPLSAMTTRPANPTCVAGDAPGSTATVQMVRDFQEVTNRRPFDIKVSPVDRNRYFYITRPGQMASFIRGQTTVVSALDIAGRIGINGPTNAYAPGGSEHYGLVSFAFHPQFATNVNRRWVFVVYNARRQGEATTTSYLSRFTFRPGNNLVVDPSSEVVLLRQLQTSSWLHHFGHVAFGPDGFLYLGSGDGTLNGGDNIPTIPAQLPGDLRGKVLRIDVDVDPGAPGLPYRIPADNRWRNVAGARGEVYALGLRNPWRFGFDPDSGRLWLGDVGDSTWEEINDITSGGNYGWPIFEATQCRPVRPTGQNCDRPQTAPAYQIAHNARSIAVIGGQVYRGTLIPSLQGQFIFSVWGTGELYSIVRTGTTYTTRLLMTDAPKINLFFTDADGEIYGMVNAGEIYRLAPAGGGGGGGIPQLLSQTGCVRAADAKLAAAGLIPFQVNAQLWSDGAVKRRWLALPDGRGITIRSDGDFAFPIGTVLIKSFYAQGKPFETRHLKLHNNGHWAGYSYQWNAAGTDATLVPEAGRSIQVAMSPGRLVTWRLPGRGECMTCHTAAAAFALGPEIAQLNSFFVYPGAGTGHQLATWDHIGLFLNNLPKPVKDLPALSAPWTASQSNIQRARSYLHANCSYCHRPGVPLRATIDLRYATPVTATRLCNVTPRITALGVPGARLLTPGDPSHSIVSLRISRRGADQMPPLASTIVDDARLMIDGWIRRADVCAPPADNDGDGVPQNADNCTGVGNAGQWDSDGDKFGDACDGDLNNDLLTNAADRALLAAAQNAVLGNPAYRNAYDFNLDGRIDTLDLQYFDTRLVNRRPGPSALRTVP